MQKIQCEGVESSDDLIAAKDIVNTVRFGGVHARTLLKIAAPSRCCERRRRAGASILVRERVNEHEREVSMPHRLLFGVARQTVLRAGISDSGAAIGTGPHKSAQHFERQ